MKGGGWAGLLAAAALLLVAGPATALDQKQRAIKPQSALVPPPPEERYDVLSPWARMNIAPADAGGDRDEDVGAQRQARVAPPKQGRGACIPVDRIAGAQLFGDSAIELTMTDGRHWRMFLADECPGLSFYQGFYYRRGKAGMICAGRDAIGARSGGECAIASIVPVQAGRKQRDDD
jgi:hypothetical protein